MLDEKPEYAKDIDPLKVSLGFCIAITLFLFFVLIAGGGQVNHRFNTRNVSAFLADCQGRTLQAIWMVVAVGVLEDLRGHA